MTVKDCTKEELLYIIDRLSWLSDFHLKTILHEIEYNREMKKIDEAKKWADVSYKKRGEAIDLLKAYEGKRPADIPLNVIDKARALFAEADKADKKWAALSNIKI